MSVQLIPTPKNYKVGEEFYSFPATITSNVSFDQAVFVFSEYCIKLGVRFSYTQHGVINMITDSSLSAGAYKIEITMTQVNLFASDLSGMHHAYATILQLIKISTASDTILLPVCDIYDYPDTGYRGMMVDLARAWHDFEYLLRYIDMCYFYKASVLHLHFTDDQSYTLPSDLYPKFSTKDRYYSQIQISNLVEYAHIRGIELVPEIDVPGHCISFQEAYPEIFGTMNIICQHPTSMQAMKDIFSELCDMFPYSKYIHIGGDEAAINKWTTCCECMEYIRGKGIDTQAEDKRLLAEQCLANFVSEIGDAVLKKERIPIAWEGFAKQVNYMISRDIIIMSWENYYQLTPELLEAGFNIINCSWDPMYIVAPVVQRSTKEVYDWSVYKWKPVHPDSPYIQVGVEISPTKQVLGGQLLAWGDHIIKQYPVVSDGIAAECTMLQDRIPYLAENTWNINKTHTYDSFSPRIASLNDRLNKILYT